MGTYRAGYGHWMRDFDGMKLTEITSKNVPSNQKLFDMFLHLMSAKYGDAHDKTIKATKIINSYYTYDDSETADYSIKQQLRELDDKIYTWAELKV